MSIKMIIPGLTRIGYIKIGDKGEERTTASGKSTRPPIKLDHFEIKTLHRDPKTDRLLVDEALMEKLGEKPRVLKVRLPFNDPDLVFQSRLSYYKNRTLFCSGDGEQALRLTEEKVGSEVRFGPATPYGPCGETCRDFQARRCRPFGVLKVILEEQQSVGGAYEFHTTSWNSIRNLEGGLAAIAATTGGIIAWIPLQLRLVPQTVQPREGGAANTAWVVQLIYDGSPDQLLREVDRLLSLRAPLMAEIRRKELDIQASMKALPPGTVLESPQESADIAQEFFPENEANGVEAADAEPDPPQEGRIEAPPPASTQTPPQARDTRPRHAVVASLRTLVDQLVEGDDAEATEAGCLQLVFNTADWEAIRTLPLSRLRAGEAQLQAMLAADDPPEDPDDADVPIEAAIDRLLDPDDAPEGDAGVLDPEAEAHLQGLAAERAAAASIGTPLGDSAPPTRTAARDAIQAHLEALVTAEARSETARRRLVAAVLKGASGLAKLTQPSQLASLDAATLTATAAQLGCVMALRQALYRRHPGEDATAQQDRADLIHHLCGVTSWGELAALPSAALEAALAQLAAAPEEPPAPQAHPPLIETDAQGYLQPEVLDGLKAWAAGQGLADVLETALETVEGYPLTPSLTPTRYYEIIGQVRRVGEARVDGAEAP